MDVPDGEETGRGWRAFDGCDKFVAFLVEDDVARRSRGSGGGRRLFEVEGANGVGFGDEPVRLIDVEATVSDDYQR